VARLQYDLNKYRAILFDVDGVLRRGSQLIPDVAETLSKLREQEVAIGVVTNNSGSGAQAIAQYLAKLGVFFQPHEVISAVDASAMWIAKHGPGKTAYVLGSQQVRDVMREHDIQVIEAPETVDYRCDYLIVGACREVNYEMLTRALRVGLQGATFLAINLDRMYPGTDGQCPAAGAMAGAVRGMLGREPDISIGKPEPGVSVSGLDLYAQDEQGNWRWVAIGKPTAVDNEVQLVGNLLPGRRMYRLYLPLYNGVRSLEIGVSTDAVFSPVKPRTEKPIVFYGSSIVQGGCASRPGTAHPALLGRRLNKPIINLGFSGNAHMETELAQLLGELDPCVFVIDPLPNMQKPLVEERAEAFVRTIKERHPHTPLVLVEDRTLQNAWILPVARERHAGSRSAFKQAYTRLVAAGVTGLHYLEGAQLLSDDGEATVDGSHPTDEGFFRMADALEPVLRALL
jgi:HAD superfamily hydrolase (TIGR01450 family)